jgi:hypothetical protein
MINDACLLCWIQHLHYGLFMLCFPPFLLLENVILIITYLFKFILNNNLILPIAPNLHLISTF